MEIKFTNKTGSVSAQMRQQAIAFLIEAKGSIASQTALNSPVGDYQGGGELKKSFGSDSFVDETNLIAYIGSTLKYAIYQEYGTGEYALNGNGRKGAWGYTGKDGKTHFTRGVRPKRMLFKAFEEKKNAVMTRGKEIFKEM